MSKNKIRLYFNGEQKEPYRLVKKPNNYFNIETNEFVSKDSQYFDINGEPVNNYGSAISFNDLRDITNIKLIIYEAEVSAGTRYVKPIKSYFIIRYNADTTDSGETYSDLDYTLVAADFTVVAIAGTNKTEYSINIADLITHNSKNPATKFSTLLIRMQKVNPSTVDEPYSKGLIRLDIEKKSSYVEFEDDCLYNYDFSRTINSNNELPNYGIYTSDGKISLLDKNKYVFERIQTNTIKNSIITDIILNDKQIAKLVGINATYPYASKTFNFNFNDYLSVFEQIKQDSLILVSGQPNTSIYTALQLYEKLVDITKEKFECEFESLNSIVSNYFGEITFYDPIIICSNLKEMWEQFLIATMCSMFINENGSIEINAYNKADESIVYEIGVDKQQQNVELNLINENVTSECSVNYLKTETIFQDLINEVIQVFDDEKTSFLDWVTNAQNWDYVNNGDYINQQLNFVVKNCYYPTSTSERYFLVEYDIPFQDNLLNGVVSFNSTWNRTNGYKSIPNYTFAYYSDKATYDNVTVNLVYDYLKVYVLNTNENGKLIRKIKFVFRYFYPSDVYNSNIEVLFQAQGIAYANETIGESKPYTNSLTLQQSSLITDKAKYKTTYNLYDYILNTTLDLYKEGRKTITFTTNNFDFGIVGLNSILSGKNGQILKVGSLIKLIGISNSTFKITKISASFEGQLNINVDAIEYIKEASYKTQLNAPVISIASKTISWSSVANAGEYDIYLNYTKIDTILTTSFLVSDYIDESIAGDYVFSVIAIPSDTDNYINSNFSNDITYSITQLAQPQNIQIIGDTLSWNSVLNATSYKIYSNGVLLTTIANTNYSLTGITTDGTYTIYVIASASGYLDSQQSLNVYYVVKQLDAPVINLINKSLSWGAVDDAEYYEIYVDGSLYATTSNLTYSIASALIQTKTYTFNVKACASLSRLKDSELSNTITYNNVVYTITAYYGTNGDEDAKYQFTIDGITYSINIGDYTEDNPLELSVTNGTSITVTTDYVEEDALIRYNGVTVNYALHQATYTFVVSNDTIIAGDYNSLVDIYD